MIEKTTRRTLAILDVGHGNSAVLRDAEGTVVIDTGPGSSLLEYLYQEAIYRIDVVLVSHADQDHIGGLVQLLASKFVEIHRVRLNTDSLKASAIWEDLRFELDQWERAGKIDFEPHLTRNAGGEFDQGPVRVEILGPSNFLAMGGPGTKDRLGRKIRTNSMSAVILLSQDDQPLALFPGDLDEIGLDEMIYTEVDMSAPLLVFPHHGGRPGRGDPRQFVQRLCELVNPRTVVFSIGRSGSGNPRPEVVAGVRKHLTNVRIACTQLSEHCASELPRLEPTHLTPDFAQGKEQRKCCAGTIVIDLDDAANVRPGQADHKEFIDRAAPLALCRKAVI